MRPAMGCAGEMRRRGVWGTGWLPLWPPRAGRRRALVERRVQVLVYAYYIGKQRTLVTVRRAWPEVAGRGGCGLSKAAELCRGAQAHALVTLGSRRVRSCYARSARAALDSLD